MVREHLNALRLIELLRSSPLQTAVTSIAEDNEGKAVNQSRSRETQLRARQRFKSADIAGFTKQLGGAP